MNVKNNKFSVAGLSGEERTRRLAARNRAHTAAMRAHPERFECSCTKPGFIYKQSSIVCARCHRLEGLSAQYELRQSRLLSESLIRAEAEGYLWDVVTAIQKGVFRPGWTGDTLRGHGIYDLSPGGKLGKLANSPGDSWPAIVATMPAVEPTPFQPVTIAHVDPGVNPDLSLITGDKSLTT